MKPSNDSTQTGVATELARLGWNDFFENQRTEDLQNEIRARVIGEERSLYTLIDENGISLLADLAGKLRHSAHDRLDLPGVGDWVAIRPRYGEGRATIDHVFARQTQLARTAVGAPVRSQLIAANVDVVFIVTSLNADLNLRRLERYLALVRDGGAEPVILLSKSDLSENAEALVEDVRSRTKIDNVIAFSSSSGQGVELIEAILRPARTFAVIGSSGVGKSTLINRLFGQEVMSTGGIREDDDKGRHTTTSRHLLAHPSGALMIDTPGMRELALWDAGEGLEETFDDVASIARDCRFTDCRHAGEPGCAVQAAIEAGTLAPERVEHHRQLERELAFQARKLDKQLASEEKERWKKISVQQRARTKARERNRGG